MYLTIDLNNLEKIKKFVDCMQNIPYNTILHGGRYSVNAKSIVGIFSLDLSKHLMLEIDADNEIDDKIAEQLSEFVIQNNEPKSIDKHRQQLTRMCEEYVSLTSNINNKEKVKHQETLDAIKHIHDVSSSHILSKLEK